MIIDWFFADYDLDPQIPLLMMMIDQILQLLMTIDPCADNDDDFAASKISKEFSWDFFC